MVSGWVVWCKKDDNKSLDTVRLTRYPEYRYPDFKIKKYLTKTSSCWPFKGTVARDYFAPIFFYQTVPPGPIRDDLGPFHFLANFHKVIGHLKRFPGVGFSPLNVSRFPGIPDTGISHFTVVPDTGILHFIDLAYIRLVRHTIDVGSMKVYLTVG